MSTQRRADFTRGKDACSARCTDSRTPDLPDEAQLLWYKQLQVSAG